MNQPSFCPCMHTTVIFTASPQSLLVCLHVRTQQQWQTTCDSLAQRSWKRTRQLSFAFPLLYFALRSSSLRTALLWFVSHQSISRNGFARLCVELTWSACIWVALLCIAVPCVTLHCTPLFIAVHYFILRWFALRCSALLCIDSLCCAWHSASLCISLR